MKRNLIYILILFILVSCNELVDWEGELITQTVSLEEFSQLKIQGDYHIQLIQDSSNYIEIHAGEKIIDEIHFNYDSVSLSINDDISFGSTKIFTRPVITLHISDIHMIFIEKSCKLTTLEPISREAILIASTGEIAEMDMEFTSGSFLFYNNGGTNGIYKFSGNVSECTCYVYSAAKLDISGLNAERKVVESYTVADAYIGSCSRLAIGIFDRGKVYYKGTPEISYVEGTDEEKLVKED